MSKASAAASAGKAVGGFLDAVVSGVRGGAGKGLGRGSYKTVAGDAGDRLPPEWLSAWRSDLLSSAVEARKITPEARLLFRPNTDGTGFVGEFVDGGGQVISKARRVEWPRQAYDEGLYPVPHLNYAKLRGDAEKGFSIAPLSNTDLKALSTTERSAVSQAMSDNVQRQIDVTMKKATSGDMAAAEDINWYFILGDSFPKIQNILKGAGFSQGEANQIISGAIALTSPQRGIIANTNIAGRALGGNFATTADQTSKVIKLLTGVTDINDPSLFSKNGQIKTYSFGQNILAAMRANQMPGGSGLLASGRPVTKSDVKALQQMAGQATDLSGLNRGTIDIHAETALVGLDPSSENMFNLQSEPVYKFAEEAFRNGLAGTDLPLASGQAGPWNRVAGIIQRRRPVLDLRSLEGTLDIDPVLSTYSTGPERLAGYIGRSSQEFSGDPSVELKALRRVVDELGGTDAIRSVTPRGMFGLAAAPLAGLAASQRPEGASIFDALRDGVRPRRRSMFDIANGGMA